MLLVPYAVAASPALVTSARGPAVVVTAGTRAAAPPAPFLLAVDQSLDLPAGSSVVLLHEGVAFSLAGPKVVEASALRSPQASTAAPAIQSLLDRKVTLAKAGASRGTRLLRPVAGTPLVSLGEVRWSCSPCADTPVAILSMTAAAPVWTSHGEGTVRYDGEPLWPGWYLLQVGGDSFTFQVVEEAERKAVAAAFSVVTPPDADAASLATIPAALWLQAGMPSEALYVLDRARAAYPDDAELTRLSAEIESRAGIRP